MTVTVGGIIVTLGVVGIVATIISTVFMLFAQGMSDAPQSRFSWWPPAISMASCIAFILIGKFSGL